MEKLITAEEFGNILKVIQKSGDQEIKEFI